MVARRIVSRALRSRQVRGPLPPGGRPGAGEVAHRVLSTTGGGEDQTVVERGSAGMLRLTETRCPQISLVPRWWVR